MKVCTFTSCKLQLLKYIYFHGKKLDENESSTDAPDEISNDIRDMEGGLWSSELLDEKCVAVNSGTESWTKLLLEVILSHTVLYGI